MEKKHYSDKKHLNIYKACHQENTTKIKNFEKEVFQLKKKVLENENLIARLKEDQQDFEVKLTREKSMKEYQKFQNEILEKQINSLAESIQKNEIYIDKLLKEKKEILSNKIMDYLNTNYEFHDINLSDYFNQSINFYEVF